MQRFLRTLDSTPLARLEQQSGSGGRPPDSRAITGAARLPLKREETQLLGEESRGGRAPMRSPVLETGDFWVEESRGGRAPMRLPVLETGNFWVEESRGGRAPMRLPVLETGDSERGWVMDL